MDSRRQGRNGSNRAASSFERLESRCIVSEAPSLLCVNDREVPALHFAALHYGGDDTRGG
jgi:hypothetical protein